LIDIAKNQDVIKIINAILNNEGIAEIKNEAKKGKENIVVVEIKRQVKTKQNK
jgi:hypothetical protein